MEGENITTTYNNINLLIFKCWMRIDTEEAWGRVVIEITLYYGR
jgi:hypothetical protein